MYKGIRIDPMPSCPFDKDMKGEVKTLPQLEKELEVIRKRLYKVVK